MKTVAIYPGTFDPITLGHLDIIKRAANLFDEIIIAVAKSARKTPILSLEQRLELINAAIKPLKNVKVEGFGGLLVEFAKQKQAGVIIRGLRAISDFDYELQLLSMNRRMAPEIETLFLAPAEQYAFISATIVREIIDIGGDVSLFLPKEVASILSKIKK